jgi:hypothetical protein
MIQNRYWQSSIEPLFQTVRRLLNKEGVFILAYQSRAEQTDRLLFKVAKEYGYEHRFLDNTPYIWSEASEILKSALHLVQFTVPSSSSS